MTASSSLYFFTGENSYQLAEERKLWIDRFAEKHGMENLQRLDGPGLTYRSLLDDVSVMPFIAEKRLVVINGVPKFEKEEMETLSQHIHPACLVLFCDPAPDKRLSAYKVLLKVATVKEFTPLSGPALRAWMKEKAAADGTTLKDDAATALLALVGEEQGTLATELHKLATYASDVAIDAPMVALLGVPSGEQEVWNLTNLVARGDATGALKYAKSLLERGEDPYSVWSLLLWMLRNIVGVHAAIVSGEGNPATIASLTGVPFPSIRTLQPLCQKLKPATLRSVVDWASATDIDLKTGGYKATADAPQELLALIDAFILRCGVLAK